MPEGEALYGHRQAFFMRFIANRGRISALSATRVHDRFHQRVWHALLH